MFVLRSRVRRRLCRTLFLFPAIDCNCLFEDVYRPSFSSSCVDVCFVIFSSIFFKTSRIAHSTPYSLLHLQHSRLNQRRDACCADIDQPSTSPRKPITSAPGQHPRIDQQTHKKRHNANQEEKKKNKGSKAQPYPFPSHRRQLHPAIRLSSFGRTFCS